VVKEVNFEFFANISKSYAPTENLYESFFVENFILYRIVSHLLGAISNNEGARGKIKFFESEKIPFETLYLEILPRYCRADGFTIKPYKKSITYQVFRPIEPNLEFWDFFKKKKLDIFRKKKRFFHFWPT